MTGPISCDVEWSPVTVYSGLSQSRINGKEGVQLGLIASLNRLEKVFEHTCSG